MNHRQLRQCHGSVFITAAIAAGVLAILVAGLLAYLGNEYRLNYRSHVWNAALHASEAGIETAYAELHYQYYMGNAGWTSARGWSNTISTPLTYQKTLSLTNSVGSQVGTVTVNVSGVAKVGNPVATAISYLATTPGGPVISRGVRATMKAVTRWPSAMLAKTDIDMNGNRIYVDSYDSTDTTKSTGTKYDVTKRQANGNIASNGTIKDTVNIGNAEIYGIGYTGTAGTVAIGSGGSIGSTFVTGDRATTYADALAMGFAQSDFNVDVPNPSLPSGATTWVGAPNPVSTGGGIGSITKSGTITTGNYRSNGLTLNSTETLNISGNVVLYINGDVRITGSTANINITSNSSLTVYVAGNVNVAGKGVVNNSATPIKNQWYGLSSSTSWQISGNGSWTGAVYAPNADFTINGGGASGDMSGGIVANSVTLNGQVQFHYDESLGKADTGAGFTFVSWQELRLVSGSWIP